MGVFARLLRRSKATEEASTAEVPADPAQAEPAAREAAEADGPAEAKEPAEAESGSEVPAVDEPTTETVGAGAGEGVEIPKQQSAEEAADSEAGEGART